MPKAIVQQSGDSLGSCPIQCTRHLWQLAFDHNQVCYCYLKVDLVQYSCVYLCEQLWSAWFRCVGQFLVSCCGCEHVQNFTSTHLLLWSGHTCSFVALCLSPRSCQLQCSCTIIDFLNLHACVYLQLFSIIQINLSALCQHNCISIDHVPCGVNQTLTLPECCLDQRVTV